MNNLKIHMIFSLLLLGTSGCSYINASKLVAPEMFGMVKISNSVYVEDIMPEKKRLELLKNHEIARKNIELMYGDVLSKPDVIACSTEQCYQRFGGTTSRAKNYGGSTFLLSPRGVTHEIISHEWSHNELHIRIDSFWIMLNLPQWFDEGIAVVVSKEPTHSEEVWHEIQKTGIPVPELKELVSLDNWQSSVGKYGDYKPNNLNPEGLKVVYTTAGNEVRQWLDSVGQKGLLDLIKLVKSGEDFTNTYQKLKK